jgi:rsbT co-antagonist protein RsbR
MTPSPESHSPLSKLLQTHHADLENDWVREQLVGTTHRKDLMNEPELRQESREFLKEFSTAVGAGASGKIEDAHWTKAREVLTRVSRTRAQRGFSPSETAAFVFSLKQPLFSRLRREFETNPEALAQEFWNVSAMIDRLGLYTMEVYQKGREELISRQQQEMLELSTPVVQLWRGILALPMIGTLDSGRTQVVMESLLQRIIETGSEVAIIDITGVPTVDTLVAQHLLKTVTAARLMGAECIISGIRPQIAATIVHLGVDLGNIATKASLADAFRLALVKTGQSIAGYGARPSALNGNFSGASAGKSLN